MSDSPTIIIDPREQTPDRARSKAGGTDQITIPKHTMITNPHLTAWPDRREFKPSPPVQGTDIFEGADFLFNPNAKDQTFSDRCRSIVERAVQRGVALREDGAGRAVVEPVTLGQAGDGEALRGGPL